MKIKSFLSLIMALCMLMGIVGCGKTVETTSEIWVEGEGETVVIEGEEGYYEGSSGSGKGSSSKGNSGSDSGKNNTDSKKGLGGATIKIAGWGAGLEPKPENSDYAAKMQTIKEIEKEFNCKISYRTIDNAVEYKDAFTAQAIAGQKFADIVTLGSGWVYPQHLRNGFLHPLDDYIDLTDIAWDQDCLKESVVNGKHYILFTANNFNQVGGIWFNRSVFDKFGLKYPSDYVAANNWNTETFLKLAKSATGKKDGVQYYGLSMKKAAVDGWASIFGGTAIQTKKGKKVYEPDAKFYKGLQFAYDLLNTHKIIPALKDGESTWNAGRAAMWMGATYEGTKYAEFISEEDLGWTYLPKGPGQSDYLCEYSSSECYGVPKAAKNPEILAKIMAKFFYPSKTGNTVEAKLKPYFYDELSYKTAVQAVKKGQENSSLSPTYTYISTGIGWGDYGITDKMSPQAYIASVKAKAQAELDDVWQQK